MPWSPVEIAGRTAEVFEPAQPASEAPTILFLHDYDGRLPSTATVWSDLFEQHGMRCVAPHDASGWWLDRVCRDFDETLTPYAHVGKNVVPWMTERWNVAPPGIGLLGVGSGGQGVLQLGFRRAREFPVVAALTPRIDFHEVHGHGTPIDVAYPDPEAARQETALLYIHPLDWPRHMLLGCDPDDGWLESLDRLASKLYSSGIPFERVPESAGESWLEPAAAHAVAFLADRLGR